MTRQKLSHDSEPEGIRLMINRGLAVSRAAYEFVLSETVARAVGSGSCMQPPAAALPKNGQVNSLMFAGRFLRFLR